jgi:hypothetical protein
VLVGKLTSDPGQEGEERSLAFEPVGQLIDDRLFDVFDGIDYGRMQGV